MSNPRHHPTIGLVDLELKMAHISLNVVDSRNNINVVVWSFLLGVYLCRKGWFLEE